MHCANIIKVKGAIMQRKMTANYYRPVLFDERDVKGGAIDFCANSVTYADMKNWFGRYRCNESFWLVPGTHCEAGVTFETEE